MISEILREQIRSLANSASPDRNRTIPGSHVFVDQIEDLVAFISRVVGHEGFGIKPRIVVKLASSGDACDRRFSSFASGLVPTIS